MKLDEHNQAVLDAVMPLILSSPPERQADLWMAAHSRQSWYTAKRLTAEALWGLILVDVCHGDLRAKLDDDLRTHGEQGSALDRQSEPDCNARLITNNVAAA